MRRATAEFVVNDYVRYDQQSPDIAALADGGFVVVFQSSGRGPYGFPDIYAQRFDAQANPIGGEFMVNETTGQSRVLPHVSARDDGGFIVSWDSVSNGDISVDVNARAFSADGTPLGHEFLVNTDTNDAQQYNSVVALAGDPLPSPIITMTTALRASLISPGWAPCLIRAQHSVPTLRM